MTAQTPSNETPGKPKDHASRQQKHPGQGTQTGSEDLDRRSNAGDKGGAKGPKPPDAK